MNKPNYHVLNNLISQVLSGTTCSLRFPGQLNSDLRKLAVNLIPFPRLHFFAIAYAPITCDTNSAYEVHDISNLAKAMFDSKNLFCGITDNNGKYMTAAAIFRGEGISSHEVDDVMNGLTTEGFVEWIPNNVKSSLCDVPPPITKVSAIFVGNTTSMKDVFNRVLGQFGKMFKRKVFLHWYTEEGMDESEFMEAQSNIADLVSEYEQYQNATIDNGEDLESGDEENEE